MNLPEILARIEKRLVATGLSASGASKAAGKSDAIRNLQRAVKENRRQGISTATLNALAPVLETTTVWLMAGAGSEVTSSEVSYPNAAETGSNKGNSGGFVRATYGGVVEAGSFREVGEFEDPDREPDYVPRDERFPRAAYFIFDVAGDSMNAADPAMRAGSRVIAIKLDNFRNRLALQSGDIVVIERTREDGALRERSVKELDLGEKETRFWPRSTNPRHQPIVVPKNFEADDATNVQVLGVVIDVMTKVRRALRPPNLCSPEVDVAYLDDLDWECAPPLSEAQNGFVGARTAMFSAVREYESALDLHDHAGALLREDFIRDRYWSWVTIACREGAFQIYHFVKALHFLGRYANDIPVDRSDALEIRRAVRTSAKAFPHAVRIRNAIGHIGETIGNRVEFDAHKLKADAVLAGGTPLQAGTLYSGISGPSYTVTHQGQVLSFEMTRIVSDVQRSICRMIAPVTSSRYFDDLDRDRRS